MKTIHFIRHGEAGHNVGFREIGPAAYFSDEYANCPLTTTGIQQCKMLQNEFAKNKLKMDIIFTSPLQRTLETTSIIFEGHNGTPIVALDELREDIHFHPPNKRDPKDEIAQKFPNIVLDKISDKDEWYGEPFPNDRYKRLSKILNESQQNNIAVVSHSKFLIDYLGKMGYPQKEIKNCQVITIQTKSLLPSKL